MVIHDMRNPSSSIQFAAQELKKILFSHFDKIKVLKKLLSKSRYHIPERQEIQIEEVKEGDLSQS
jgi:hypothetical protein